jgi:LacI family transcriptional regulator
MSRLSIKDIAQRADVCIGTVSRVINNLDRVHPETREKILKIIKDTGYRPSTLGRALVSGKTRNVLVALHDFTDPYCAVLSKHFSRLWHELDFRMLIGDADNNAALEREFLARAQDGSVDGLIISPIPGRNNTLIYREMIKKGRPLVTIDSRIEGVKTNCILYDDYAAACMAVEHLAAKGHRHIAFMHWRPDYQTVKDRLRGYRETLRRLNLDPDGSFQEPLPSLQSELTEAIRTVLRNQPATTALVTENEMVAMICINTLLQAGYRVPQDIAVVAIGDTLANHFTPVPLSTVSLRHDLMCQKAVERLHHLIGETQSAKNPITEETIKPELIIRASA